jgi:hypothetical protein
MNWKWSVRKWSWYTLSDSPGICLKELREITQTSARVLGALAENWTGCLLKIITNVAAWSKFLDHKMLSTSADMYMHCWSYVLLQWTFAHSDKYMYHRLYRSKLHFANKLYLCVSYGFQIKHRFLPKSLYWASLCHGKVLCHVWSRNWNCKYHLDEFQACLQKNCKILWRIDPLLGKNLGTNNETRAVAMQRRGKHASTTIELLLETVLCNPLLGSCNIWTTTMENGVFSTWSVPRSYLTEKLGYPVSLWKED